jgi:hypothetical protein
MIDKMKSLINSRRFWVAIGGVVIVVFDSAGLGLTHDQINHVVLLGGAWIVGDSLRVT